MADGPVRASAGVAVQHLVLRVRDIQASHRFYTEILGFEQCGALDPEKFPFDMRFYRGHPDHHHDLALCQLLDVESAPPVEAPWQMILGKTPGIDHIAMCYPSREAWLDQLQWMKSQDVEFLIRGDHGMTHSVYVSDPDGNGIEVLYDLPREVWQGDVNEALNYFEPKDPTSDEALVDTTDYARFDAAKH